MNREKKFFIALGWVTLLVFPLIGLMIYEWLEGGWFHVFKGGWAIWFQLPLGAVIGFLIGWLLKCYLKTNWMNEVRNTYRGLLKPVGLERAEYVFLSFCAGVGEEILFRGVIQHFAGVYITAVLFVAMHGYLNPVNRKVLSYGLILTAIFIGVGFLAVYTGIYTCMVIHMIADIFLFGMLDEDEAGEIPDEGYENDNADYGEN